MSKPIRRRRMLNAPKGIDAISARRSVRRNTALGFLYEDCKGDSKKGDPLNFKINGFLRALQQELLATEGRPSAAVQQEARDADNASKRIRRSDSPFKAFEKSVNSGMAYSAPIVPERLKTPIFEYESETLNSQATQAITEII